MSCDFFWAHGLITVYLEMGFFGYIVTMSSVYHGKTLNLNYYG